MTYLTSRMLEQLDGRLSDRDRDLVRQVDRLRLVSGGQLRRLAYADLELRSAQRQLKRLVELGLLTRLERRIGGVRAGSDGAIYELALGGQRLLSHWATATGKARTSPEPGQRFVAHTVAASEVYVRLVEADQSGGLELLEHQAEPTAWRSRVGPYGQVAWLRPDGFVRLGLGTRELWWFIEVDQATESLSVIRRQASAYLAHYQAGVEPVMPRVAWLAPTQRRAALLLGALHGLGDVAAELFVAGCQDDVVAVLAGGSA